MRWWRKDNSTDLEKRVEALEKAFHKLVEDRDLLREEFRRLRGTVTGGKRLRTPGMNGSEIPFGDKEALRAYAGLTGNGRYKHPEE